MTTWTEKTEQPETWAVITQQTRGFDPAGFDNTPRFDTGSTAGIWTARLEQAENWTVAS